MSKALIPATIIASNICEDMGDSDEMKHFRVMKKVALAFKELHLYISPELSVQSTILSMDSDQVELPCDFIYATKIGVLNNGCLVTLDLNKNLRDNNIRTKDSQIQAGVNGLLDGSIVATEFYAFHNVFRGSNWLGEMYGCGSGYHADTWYNINEGILEFSSILADIGGELVVEYKSDGVKEAYRLIPSEMELAVMHYAKSLMYEDTRPGLAADFKGKYDIQYNRIKRLYSHRDPEYLAWLFASYNEPAPR